MPFVSVLFFCVLATGITSGNSRRQGYTVKGRFLCGTLPAANVIIKLIDKGKSLADKIIPSSDL